MGRDLSSRLSQHVPPSTGEHRTDVGQHRYLIGSPASWRPGGRWRAENFLLSQDPTHAERRGIPVSYPPKQGKVLFLGTVLCDTGPATGAVLGRGPHRRKHPSSIHELFAPRGPVKGCGCAALQGANMSGCCHLVANLPHSLSNLWS